MRPNRPLASSSPLSGKGLLFLLAVFSCASALRCLFPSCGLPTAGLATSPGGAAFDAGWGCSGGGLGAATGERRSACFAAGAGSGLARCAGCCAADAGGATCGGRATAGGADCCGDGCVVGASGATCGGTAFGSAARCGGGGATVCPRCSLCPRCSGGFAVGSGGETCGRGATVGAAGRCGGGCVAAAGGATCAGTAGVGAACFGDGSGATGCPRCSVFPRCSCGCAAGAGGVARAGAARGVGAPGAPEITGAAGAFRSSDFPRASPGLALGAAGGGRMVGGAFCGCAITLTTGAGAAAAGFSSLRAASLVEWFPRLRCQLLLLRREPNVCCRRGSAGDDRPLERARRAACRHGRRRHARFFVSGPRAARTLPATDQ